MPLGFLRGTGVNDELDGSTSKSAVTFTVANQDIPRGLVLSKDQLTELSQNTPYKMECEIVQSLAKWKRIMLDRLNVQVGEGIYCDSTSIRKGYKGDVTHSVVADQYDFEIKITDEMRNVEQLKQYVKIIYKIIVDCEEYILKKYPHIIDETHQTSKDYRLPKDITFITSQELYDMYPTLDVHERETAAVNKYGSVFIIGMGWPMNDGSIAEEIRSPSYDDWTMNGDIIVKHPLTGYRHELSSMGIRVNSESLIKQLQHRNVYEKEVNLPYQQAIINNQLPLSYGGGLGISRLLMLLLRTCHIGEVQCGLWHDEHYNQLHDIGGIDIIPDRIITYHDDSSSNNDTKLHP